jgi:mycofactocin precursor
MSNGKRSGMPQQPSAVNEDAPDTEQLLEDVLVDDVLVEEVSIDGMCGVY